MNAPSTYTVVATLLCFLLSVGASAIAINLYSLLRTGEFGSSWRVLIIASVLFSLGQALRLAEVCDVPYAQKLQLSSITDLCFVLALAYAFFLQRQVFSETRHIRRRTDEVEVEDDAVVSVYQA